MVSDNSNFVSIQHVDLIIGNSFMLATQNHDCLIYTIAHSVQMSNLLFFILEPKVFSIFATVKLDNRHSVSTIEAWVLALCKPVKLINCIVQILAKSPETDCKLLFLLFQIHQSSEERWNNVVSAL